MLESGSTLCSKAGSMKVDLLDELVNTPDDEIGCKHSFWLSEDSLDAHVFGLVLLSVMVGGWKTTGLSECEFSVFSTL